MEEYKSLPARFCKLLLPELCVGLQMNVPKRFSQLFGNMIPKNVRLVLRNGDELNVDYIREKSIFNGMDKFFKKCNCSNGGIIVFQYNGGAEFWVYTMPGNSACEEEGVPFFDGGCKFVKILLCVKALPEKIVLPHNFALSYGDVIPQFVDYRLTNGKIFKGFYNAADKTLNFLHELVVYSKIKFGEAIVFTYHGEGLFDVSVFSTSALEKELISDDEKIPFPCTANLNGFKITVLPYHLLEYSHGVCIHKKYDSATKSVKHGEYINVFLKERSWLLCIRKRNKRTTIHDGWVRFWKDLKLVLGDLCVFFKRGHSNEFDVFVVKNDTIDLD